MPVRCRSRDPRRARAEFNQRTSQSTDVALGPADPAPCKQGGLALGHTPETGEELLAYRRLRSTAKADNANRRQLDRNVREEPRDNPSLSTEGFRIASLTMKTRTNRALRSSPLARGREGATRHVLSSERGLFSTMDRPFARLPLPRRERGTNAEALAN